MELTLESAFSTGGLVGHLSYLLLIVSMVMRVMWVLRVFVILSAFTAIAYDFIWLKDPVGVFWESLLVLVNIVQLSITYAQTRFEKFTDHEASFVHGAFPGLSNTLKRKVIRKGHWLEADAGTVITRAGEPVEKLVFIADGTVTPIRYWAIRGDDLRSLVESNEEINQAVYASFHRNMLTKLVEANRLLDKSGGMSIA